MTLIVSLPRNYVGYKVLRADVSGHSLSSYLSSVAHFQGKTELVLLVCPIKSLFPVP